MCGALIKPHMYDNIPDHDKEISDSIYYNVAFML